VVRHGFDDPARVHWQSHATWGKDPFGNGGKTIGQWGCPAASIAEALRFFDMDPNATPRTVVKDALASSPPVWAADTSLAVLPRLARSAGIICSDFGWRDITDEAMSLAVRKHIDAGGVVWLQVDKDDDGRGDHWTCAFAYDEKWIYITDSATAKVERLGVDTMHGQAVWGGKPKTYHAVRAYPLTRPPIAG
jgi:hypothetical protein